MRGAGPGAGMRGLHSCRRAGGVSRWPELTLVTTGLFEGAGAHGNTGKNESASPKPLRGKHRPAVGGRGLRPPSPDSPMKQIRAPARVLGAESRQTPTTATGSASSVPQTRPGDGAFEGRVRGRRGGDAPHAKGETQSLPEPKEFSPLKYRKIQVRKTAFCLVSKTEGVK